MSTRRALLWTALGGGSLALLAHCGSSPALLAEPTDDGGSSNDGSASRGGDSGGDGSTGGAGGGGGGVDVGGSSSDGGSSATLRTLADYVGVNGFIDDPIAKLAPIGKVREYHDWGWLADNYAPSPAYPQATYTFMNFNGWDWDVFFSSLQDAGTSGFPAVQGSVPWLNDSAIPPVDAGADAAAAASYVAHADVMFQFAARYGKVAVADSELKLETNPAQTRLSGQGTVAYYENFNEEDNDASFSAEDFAAMCSADYDGDQGRLGTTFGVKNADPNAQLVMGGLSGKYGSGSTWVSSITGYLDGMRAWATAHRGGSFPADVLNVHYYSFGAGGSAPGLSPEADGVEAKLAAITAYRDANLPGKPVWWTEFGYDTNAQSVLRAPAIGSNSAQVVQGQWLVRELLAGLQAGIDVATVYILRDSSETDSTQFATSGLTLPKGDWTPKTSWFYLATFRARMKTMHFTGMGTSSNPDVLVANFADAASSGGAIVVWAKTSTAQVIPSYALALPASVTSASSVTLTDQQANGVEAPLTPTAGAVTVQVTETPLIVLTNGT